MYSDLVSNAMRVGKLPFTATDDPAHADTALAVSVELLSMGFFVLPDDLSVFSVDDLTVVMEAASHISGDDRHWAPLFPNFPEGVKSTPKSQLISGQMTYYRTTGQTGTTSRSGDDFELRIGEALENARPLTVIDEDGIRALISDLVLSPVALSSMERDLLYDAVDHLRVSDTEISDLTGKARNAENIGNLAAALLMAGHGDLFSIMAPEVRTLDGLLRVWLTRYAKLVDRNDSHDVFLALNVSKMRMRSAPRADRRLLLTRLGELSGGWNADRLISRRDGWRRVMRAVHPYSIPHGEQTRRALDIIHDNIEYSTFNSLIEKALLDEDLDEILRLVKVRPSELIRRLLKLAEIADGEVGDICDSIREIGHRVPVITLLSAYDGVLASDQERPRLIRVKGQSNHLISNGGKILDSQVRGDLLDALKSAVITRLSETKAPSTPVGVSSTDPVPLVARDLSTSDRVLARGQTLRPVGEGDILRLFVHWYNISDDIRGDVGVDLDLGAVFLDEEFDVINSVTWNTWERTSDLASYSGDVTYAPRPHGGTEFIDIDLDKVRKDHPEVKWIAHSVVSYSGHSINKVDHLIGAMYRKDASASFDPRTVVSAATSTLDTTVFIGMVVNVETGEAIWADTSSGGDYSSRSIAESKTVGPLLRAEIGRERLSQGELASWYAEAHGVDMVQEAPSNDLITTVLSA